MRKHITAQSKINEIQMLINKKKYKDKVFILLEGNTDIKLFRKLFDNDSVQLESIDGKENVEIATELVSKKYYDRILGLYDADFDHLNNRKPKLEIQFVTDTHDSETMMIQSSAINSVISEFGKKEYIDGLIRSLVRKSLEACYEIGLIRWINHNEDLGLNFKDLDFEEFVTVNNLNASLDRNSFIDTILSNTTNPVISSSELEIKIEEYAEKDGEPFHVCCGHDLCEVMPLILSQDDVGVYKINKVKFESSLRLSYSKSEFEKTTLFKKLEDWGVEKNKNLFAA